jgi:hypothetical protein
MRSAVPSSLRRATALLALGLVTACSPGPTPSPTGGGPPVGPTSSAAANGSPEPSIDPSAIYAAIAAQVEQIRDLRPNADVAPALIDADQLRANLTADFDRNNPPAVVALTQGVYLELGLLPAGGSLRSAYLDLQAGQVAGYYSADDKRLFVVSRSGGVGPTQRVTYAHEFTHQLQDQNFDLSKLGLDATDQGDRSLGRLALVEGDAVTTQTTWMTSNLSSTDLAQLLTDASDPVALAALQNAPAILRTTSLFPYTSGAMFVQALMAAGGLPAVNAAFAHPPDSTAQVLHPDLYASRTKPLAVELPDSLAASLGPGWQLLGEDTLGELQIRGWLTADGVDSGTASAAAAGWTGDRLAILGGPSGQLALALVIRWSSPGDVNEFATAYRAITARLGGPSSYDATRGDNSVSIVIAPTVELARILAGDLQP